LLLKGNKIKSVSLSSYYIIWNKLINNDMKK
jgi:hypothetical protein